MRSEDKKTKNSSYSLFNRFVTIITFSFISLVVLVCFNIKKSFEETIQQRLTYLTRNFENLFNENLNNLESNILVFSSLRDSINKVKWDVDSLDLFCPLMPKDNQINLDNSSKFLTSNPYISRALKREIFISFESELKPGLSDELNFHLSSVSTSSRASLSFNSCLKLNSVKNHLRKEIKSLQKNSFLALNNLTEKVYYENRMISFIEKLIFGIKNSRQNLYYTRSFKNKINLNLYNLNGEIIATDNQYYSNINPKEIFKNFVNEDVHIIKFDNKEIFMQYKLKNFPIYIVLSQQIHLAIIDYLIYLSLYKYELLFAFLVSIIFIIIFYNVILDPLIKLSKAAMLLSNGQINIELDEIRSIEGKQVVQALDKIKLFLSQESELIQETTEIRNSLALSNLRLENKINQRTQELEKAIEAKVQFINQITHEIATPITGVTIHLENTIKFWYEMNEEKKLESINQIHFESKRILNIVSYFLEYSKLSKSRHPLNLTKEDIALITREIIDECSESYLKQKNISINFTNDYIYEAFVDRDKIKKVIKELVINAVRYTPIGGDISIKIAAKRTNFKSKLLNAIQFMIHDQGTGLDQKEITDIFNPFCQGQNFRGNFGNVGLGLAFCKDVINSHGGKIWAANNKDGGATFSFLIPIARSRDESNYPSSLDLHHSMPNILIIDDENNCLESLDLILLGTNYNVIKANSANAGMKYLSKHHNSVSLILLDLMMPDKYGINCLQEIKKDPDLRNIPVIIQTGVSDEEEILKAFELGATSFIKKPYNKSLVLLEIEKVFKSYNIFRENK